MLRKKTSLGHVVVGVLREPVAEPGVANQIGQTGSKLLGRMVDETSLAWPDHTRIHSRTGQGRDAVRSTFEELELGLVMIEACRLQRQQRDVGLVKQTMISVVGA